MWQICFKEYDSNGMLVGLIPLKSVKVRSQWKKINAYLDACRDGIVREVQFYRNGKHYPSIVSDGTYRQFHEPITAMLPLFEYAKRVTGK